jgi:hypothetical protein
MKDDKREQRETKRVVKRLGHKRVRNTIKRVLTEDPDEAPHVEDDFGRHRSADLNGIDRDSTRRRD